MYKWNWWELYDKIDKSESYWAYNQELHLLDTYQHTLQQYLTKYLTDVGCGNGQKAIHLLQDTSVLHDVTYLASDYSSSMIDLAEKNIIEKIPNIKLGNHQIMRPGNELLTNSLDENTYFRVGCTIGNFLDKQDIIHQIKNMSNSWTLKGNTIIFTYFDIPKTSEAIQKTKQLYDNREAETWIMNGLQNIGLDTTRFDYNVEYSLSDTCIYVWIKAKEDIEINLSWKNISIKKWEVFNVIKSKRFGLEEIKSILKQSWAKLEKHISDWDISMIVAKQDPKYFRKTMKIAALSSLLLAWVLAWGVGGHYLSEQKQNHENKEFLKKNLQHKYSSTASYDSRERTDPDKTLWTRLKIDQATEDFYNDFLAIYGSWNATEKELSNLKDLMVQHFLQSDANGILINLDKVYAGGFITPENNQKELKLFISNYNQYLFERWFNTIPYKDIQQYKDACMFTSSLQWDLVINHQESETWNTFPNVEVDWTKYQKEFDDLLIDLKSKGLWMSLPTHTFGYQKLGNYLHTNWDSYDVLVLNDNDEHFIVAHKKTAEESICFDRRQSHTYTKQEWEIVAKDFLDHRSK